jgi:uncharacterized coiled-coil DUF342 family protein/predicted regulator of Ras-like GTPase activity (Roadblock/LC7/MglB family)
MVLLTERSREIADLSLELARTKTDGLRHLEDAQNAARQLKRVNERLAEQGQAKQALLTERSQLHDEVETLKWELSSARGIATQAEQELAAAVSEKSRLRQELDAARRTLEAREGAWEQEREQLGITVCGLALEIQSEHQAARVLERKWILSAPRCETESTQVVGSTQELGPIDYRLTKVTALEEELHRLREERALLSAKVRELERDRGASIELVRLQQESRELLVERQLLERKLEDAQLRDQDRERLRNQVTELQQSQRNVDSLRAEIERLRAKLYNTPLNSGTFPVGSRVDAIAMGVEPSRDLASELAELAQYIDARNAVVADGLGFPVAAVGDPSDYTNLAAVAGEADRFGCLARQILGLAEVTQLTVEDRQGQIAHFRYFAVEEYVMSVGTLGTQVPRKEELDRVVGLTRHTLTVPRGYGDLPSEGQPQRASGPSPRPTSDPARAADDPDLLREAR